MHQIPDFNPESIGELKRRFALALAKPVEVDEMIRGIDGSDPNPRTLHSTHIFDFYIGMRMIVTKDVLPIKNYVEFIHLSFGVADGKFNQNIRSPAHLAAIARKTASDFGIKEKAKYEQVTDRVVHLFFHPSSV